MNSLVNKVSKSGFARVLLQLLASICMGFFRDNRRLYSPINSVPNNKAILRLENKTRRNFTTIVTNLNGTFRKHDFSRMFSAGVDLGNLCIIFAALLYTA